MQSLAIPVGDETLFRSFTSLRHASQEKGPLSVARRMEVLDELAKALLRRSDDMAEAVRTDFGHRSVHETRLADLFPVVSGLRHARRHLRKWIKPRRRPISMMFRPASGEVIHQPLGVVGIIGPWNYPVQLTLGPLIGAIAAGNRVMIKPSEFTPSTAALIASIVEEVFDPDEVRVVQGGADVARAFAGLAFDHLLFTGSTSVGRQVMRAAADNLVPVTLELGGKSPAIVAPDFPVERAAERIAVGKLFNAGQTCIAPDYALVPRHLEAAFIDAFATAALRLYPTIADNPDYTAIINERHLKRLTQLVDDACTRGAILREIYSTGGAIERHAGKMAPVLLSSVPEEAAVMQEEIFGPVLPIVAYDTLEEAYAFINARPRPLALYLFSHDRTIVDRTLARTVSGGVAVNDTLLHCVQEELPFGGVGASGMGTYHGEAGFRTFSHAKSVFHQARFNGSGLTKPPYGRMVERLLGLVLR
ncbi:coniferyl aldehyde dehydrogenase [Microvirga rosea]|uniref:coniferyl aldehyde dehydrogenase n=1 Tax=Microvirga rosea TaxID=2715425 RepID=UPI001D0A1129|nr:coniferyl aldehyde dehydrogenase [Microvirga rosea]MCB8819872.1 coniferyl aldehyde dehydrogenase [Microvirga rosea]